MEEIVSILMRRDNMTREDAIDLFLQTEEEIQEAISDGASYDDIQDILEYNLGLEPDYLDYFIMQEEKSNGYCING